MNPKKELLWGLYGYYSESVSVSLGLGIGVRVPIPIPKGSMYLYSRYLSLKAVFCIGTLRPKYTIYGYMEPLGLQAQGAREFEQPDSPPPRVQGLR